MPTDDDYGRRERLLLHQSAAGQYGQPSSPLRAGSSTANPTNSSANGKSSTASSNTSSSSSAHEHPYGRQQPISQSLGYSSRYDSDQARQSYQQLSSVCDRSHSSKKANSSVGNSGEYANSSVLIAAATAGGSVANPFAGAETFLHSPPSPAPAGSDRFVPPPPLSPSVSDKYSSSQSLANYHPTDRLLSSGGASVTRDQQQQQQQQSKEQRSFSSTDRLLAAVSAASAASDAAKEQQRYSASSTERLLASASPVLGVLSERCGYGGVSKDGSVSSSGSSSSSIRYGISSTERLLTSSPIHAPVPEKFANSSTSSSATNGGKSSGGYFKDSPLHERYHHGSQQTSSQHYNSCSSSAAAAERYSPNPEGARYSSSERILGGSSNAGAEQQISRRYSTDQALESACQKYADSRASPGPTEFTNRYQGYQESSGTSGSGQRYGGTSDRFNDLALQRYAQNRPSDRYSAGNERYLSSNTSSAHDSRQTGTCELNRYSSSSTERLLASSSSPSLTESRDGHNQTFSSGSSIGAQSGEVSQSRYSTLSPTPDGVANPSGGHHSLNCHLQQSSSKQSSSDKYHHHHHQHQSQSQSQSQQQHLSSGKQSYGSERVGSYDHLCSDQFIERVGDRYGLDRFSGADSRFPSSGSDRYHCTTTERYSPARGNADKYLSLPKSKDRYSGRVANSCASISSRASDSGYGNGGSSYVPPTAHTPVERYVPQPPPEVLYPDRYVDRYVPPGAHTPADRYVPVSEPSDSFLRRGNDLSYHHSYRAAAPSGYPYQSTTTTTTTTHYRYRGLNATAYQSPGRIGGSPSSSSSSSSTSVQRDGFSTSPLLRSKVHDFNNGSSGSSSRGSGQSSQQTQSHQQPACCAEVATPSQRTSACCQSARRSMPPGALPSIPQQTGLSSWQQSPNSATTNTSTLSSTDNDNSGGSGQSISLYPVNQQQSPQPQLSQQGSTESSSTSTPTTSSNSAATMATCASGSNASTASAGAAAPAPTSAPNITRSVSAPTGQQPRVQIQASTSTTPSSGTRPKLRRNQSRTEVIKNYIKQETATFFGVNEETEATEKQKWLDRRRRMASRKYGTLLPEYRPPDPDITKDVPDALDAADPVTLRKWQRPVRRKDSVARMTLSGIQYMVDTLRRQKGSERAESSRSFPPSAVHATEDAQTDDGGVTTDAALDDDEEEAFFQAPAKVAPPPTGQENLQAQQLVDEASLDDVNVTQDALRNVSVVDGAEPLTRIWSPSAMPEHKPEDRAIVDGHSRGHRSRNVPTKDHYTLRSRPEMYQHHQQQHHQRPLSDVQVSMHAEDPRRQKARFGGKRIAPSTIDRVFDNSNRRQYGMGIVGRFFGRSFRKSVASKPDVRKQLDDIEDHRPYFTYWITTVQVLILIFSIACYGFGPVGFDLAHRSSLVLVTSLSLQQVEYQEPANFWIGPRASDLIHLGAKFAPCMRRDIKILKEIDVWREKERDTACCIRNDDSGCVQSSRAECSVRGMSSTSTNTISTWKKWGPADSGPGGRISGSVCGLDPKFCDAPASIAPYEWPDDITKWPICRKINPLSQRFRAKDAHLHGNANFPVGRYKDKMAEHMICEVIGHPCCIGIHGSCRITTKEYCDFVHGYFHEEASLCSQVECLHDVCGMIPFLNPEWPDQFYRLFTTMFLHAGILHIAITLVVQYFLMRDLEKLTGSIRIMLIYFIGALAGNLASAIFVPYRAEVGPAGAHFALLATLVVEVLHCWPMLKYPRRALSKLIFILIGLLCLGVLPWIDNYAHLFGFIFGFLAAYALMPFISFGHYDRRRKIVVIWICTVLIVGLFTLLLALFYSVPMYECEICKLFNCIPLTRDFCASQNINFKKEEPV